jgi:hypothetical protein
VVERSPAAERDPVVPGALQVVDGEALRLHHEAPVPPDLGPLLGRERGGEHDLRVDRQDLPPVALEPAEVGLPRQDHDLGLHLAAAGVEHRAPLEVVPTDRGALVDDDPGGLGGPGQPPHQTAGVHGGEGLGEEPRPGALHPDELGHLTGLQPAEELGLPELDHLLVRPAESGHLMPTPGHHQHPVAVEVGVDPVALERALDLVDGPDQGPVGGAGGVQPVAGDHLGVAHRDLR